MRYARLGQTDLQVSAIAFGTWAFGGDWGTADLEEGQDAIEYALSLGINLFDTAQGYGFGLAEELLGRALRERADREDVIIATKGGLRMLHTPPQETAQALADLVAEGKIRHVGLSNYDADQMETFGRFGPVHTLQPPYHLFRREIENTRPSTATWPSWSS